MSVCSWTRAIVHTRAEQLELTVQTRNLGPKESPSEPQTHSNPMLLRVYLNAVNPKPYKPRGHALVSCNLEKQ